MKKWLKISLLLVTGLVLIAAGGVGFLMYKVKYGIASYETEPHEIEVPQDMTTLLLFSKTTGFRHGESIDASKVAFQKMALEYGWFLYETEDAGIFNKNQLALFDLVVYNNSTGRCLTDDQRGVLENYVSDGGTILGIHGTGDFSHPEWEWHTADFIGASFSHHPIKNHLQTTTLTLASSDSVLTTDLPASWDHTEEWYVFFDHPQDNGFEILLRIDGEAIDPDGNMLWITDKNFGMGTDHPVAWYNTYGRGKVFYTSLGHTAEVWDDPLFIQLLTNVVNWSVN